MKTTAINAPAQLRTAMHIGSFMDIIFLNLIKNFNPEINLIIQWNALGKFREKDETNEQASFDDLFNQMKKLVNNYCGEKEIFHLLDDTKEVYEEVLDIVIKLIKEDIVKLKEYNSLYCPKCDSYLGPIEQNLKTCRICHSSLENKKTFDLFMTVDKKIVHKASKKISFFPEKMKNRFLGVLADMPPEFIISKSRSSGFSIDQVDERLKNRVLDPKFVYSLFPILIKKMGFSEVNTIVIGEDILGRYLYYLLSNNQTALNKNLKVFVHGMLVSNGKKISKNGNFPEISNINNFLEIYSWEHLKLLCVSSTFGDNIDFNQKILDVSRLIIKKKNVMIFLESIQEKKIITNSIITETEKNILKHFKILEKSLTEFKLFEFYSNYHLLWFDLLSRTYISDLKNNIGSQNGLKKIIENLPTIF